MADEMGGAINEAELRCFILKRLDEFDSRSKIIYAICEQTGWNWPKAKAFFEGHEAGCREEVELRRLTIEHLKKLESPSQIIFAICEKTGWNWQKAETYFESIEAGCREEVGAEEFPIKFMLEFILFFAGLFMIGCSTAGVIYTYHIVLGPTINSGFLDLVQQIYETSKVLIATFVTGSAFLAGSLIRMRKAWGYILFRNKRKPKIKR